MVGYVVELLGCCGYALCCKSSSAECIIMTEREFHNFRQFYPVRESFLFLLFYPVKEGFLVLLFYPVREVQVYPVWKVQTSSSFKFKFLVFKFF